MAGMYFDDLFNAVGYSFAVLDLIGVNDVGGAVTIGLAHYSTAAEVDQLVRALASLG